MKLSRLTMALAVCNASLGCVIGIDVAPSGGAVANDAVGPEEAGPAGDAARDGAGVDAGRDVRPAERSLPDSPAASPGCGFAQIVTKDFFNSIFPKPHPGDAAG